MAGDLIRVRLKSPAKVGARWLKAAEEAVTEEEFTVLQAEGLIDPGYAEVVPAATGEALLTFTQAEFDAAVAEAAQRLADAGIGAAIGATMKPMEERLAAAEAQCADLAELVASLRQVNAELTAQLDARAESPAPIAPGEKVPETAEAGISPARTDTPPSEKAAKTAPQKGAAAKTKG